MARCVRVGHLWWTCEALKMALQPLYRWLVDRMIDGKLDNGHWASCPVRRRGHRCPSLGPGSGHRRFQW
jgi:hypothetical protein